MQHRHWLWLAALAAGNAGAQSAVRPDPADPGARVPETVYRSAFDGYQKHELSKQVPWREANDEVGRVGGHVGILRDEAAGKKGREPGDVPDARDSGSGVDGTRGKGEPSGARQ